MAEKNLLGTIRKQLREKPATPGMTDQTERATGLLRAKLGRATGPGAAQPRASAIKEKQAVQQTQLGAEQLQQQGRLQAERLGEQQAGLEQREAQDVQATQEQRQAQLERFQQQADSLMNNVTRQFGELDLRKRGAALEQAGFVARFNSQKYIDELQRRGQRRRLDNSLEFKTELYKEAWGDDLKMFKQGEEFKNMLAQDEAEFRKELADIDINMALDMARLAAKEQATAAAVSGVTNATKAYIKHSKEEK